jgi:hypothetical protein
MSRRLLFLVIHTDIPPDRKLNETRENGCAQGKWTANFCMPRNKRPNRGVFCSRDGKSTDTAYNPAHPDIQLVVKYSASFEMRAL